jgi:predicted nucleic acid-binding protein
MPKYDEIIYLDTSVITAWIKNENRKNNEMDGVEFCFDRIINGNIKVVTSALTIPEILAGKFPAGKVDDFERTILKRRNFETISVDIKIARLAQQIRDYYSQRNKNIKTADATHLATAIYYEVNALYTFDGDDLLPLSGNVAGYNLLICKPPLPKQKRLIFPN